MSNPGQPSDELTVQANAMIRVITEQRDDAQARLANLAGEHAIVALRLEKLTKELEIAKAAAAPPANPEVIDATATEVSDGA